MKFLSNLLIAVMAVYVSMAFAQNNADTIFYGGPIVTVNAKNEEVEALAVKDGKIVALGAKSDVIKGWQASTTKIVNLQGNTAMPGLIDPHVHIILTAVGEYIWLDLSNFTTKYDTVATLSNKLKAHLKTLPKGQ
jgi:predicted amidohydrolase YtcJ